MMIIYIEGRRLWRQEIQLSGVIVSGSVLIMRGRSMTRGGVQGRLSGEEGTAVSMRGVGAGVARMSREAMMWSTSMVE
jgi:hypothetical protein